MGLSALTNVVVAASSVMRMGRRGIMSAAGVSSALKTLDRSATLRAESVRHCTKTFMKTRNELNELNELALRDLDCRSDDERSSHTALFEQRPLKDAWQLTYFMRCAVVRVHQVLWRAFKLSSSIPEACPYDCVESNC